jgi:hypothetical protein
MLLFNRGNQVHSLEMKKIIKKVETKEKAKQKIKEKSQARIKEKLDFFEGIRNFNNEVLNLEQNLAKIDEQIEGENYRVIFNITENEDYMNPTVGFRNKDFQEFFEKTTDSKIVISEEDIQDVDIFYYNNKIYFFNYESSEDEDCFDLIVTEVDNIYACLKVSEYYEAIIMNIKSYIRSCVYTALNEVLETQV